MFFLKGGFYQVAQMLVVAGTAFCSCVHILCSIIGLLIINRIQIPLYITPKERFGSQKKDIVRKCRLILCFNLSDEFFGFFGLYLLGLFEGFGAVRVLLFEQLVTFDDFLKSF